MAFLKLQPKSVFIVRLSSRRSLCKSVAKISLFDWLLDSYGRLDSRMTFVIFQLKIFISEAED